MSSYDNYDAIRFQNQLASYTKPRLWKQEVTADMSVYSRPEPTSKTKIPKISDTNIFTRKMSRPMPHINI